MSGPKPRIICSTGSFWMWDLDRAMAALARAGFTGAELMVTRDHRTQSAEVASSIAAKEGIELVALHAPMLVLTRRIWGPSFLPIIERSTEMASKIGADVVVVHPPYMWELKYQTWLLNQMDRFSAEKKVAIAVENMFRLWVRGRPIRGHRWMSPSDLKGFSQLTLDTSHCGVDGFDILEALDIVGPQMAHVHLSDSKCDHRDNHLLPGSGQLPLKEFVSRLPEVGFRGNLSLELDLRSIVEDAAKLDDSLRRAKEFCEDALA